MPYDDYTVAIARTVDHLTSNGQRVVTGDEIAHRMMPYGPTPEDVAGVHKRLIKAIGWLGEDGQQFYPLTAVYFDIHSNGPPETTEDAEECLARTLPLTVGVGRSLGDEDLIWQVREHRLIDERVKGIARNANHLATAIERGQISQEALDAGIARVRTETPPDDPELTQGIVRQLTMGI